MGSELSRHDARHACVAQLGVCGEAWLAWHRCWRDGMLCAVVCSRSIASDAAGVWFGAGGSTDQGMQRVHIMLDAA
jgi:hypothetical protein